MDCCKGRPAQAGKPSCHQLQTTSESWSQLWQVPAIPGPKALNYKLKLQYKSRLSVLAPQHCSQVPATGFGSKLHLSLCLCLLSSLVLTTCACVHDTELRAIYPTDKMLHFLKLCLKSILGHSESFWQKKFWVKKVGGVQYLVIFWRFLDFENFYKCLTFQGGKNIFFQKVPQ